MTKDSRHVGFEISAIGNMLKRKSPKPSSTLTKMQMWIIGYIYNKKDGDVFQGELERTFHVTRATASDVLKRMERDGLIIRTPSPLDARMKKITLTEEAIQIADKVRQNIARNERLMVQGISEEDLNTFYSVIDKIKENLANSLDEQ